MSSFRDDAYTGIDNIEMMAEAKNYNAYLVRLITRDLKKTRTLVDFGAGSGTYAKMLANEGYKVHCIEPDAILAGILSGAGLSVSEFVGETEGDIEFLYSLNVLEHIKDDLGAVKDIFFHMKEGGEVFIYVPAFIVLYTSMDKKIGHYRRYTRKQLVQLFERVGFVVDEAWYADSLGFFITLLYKWVGSKQGDINPKALKIYDTFIFPLSRFCDSFLSSFLGKNVMIRAHKP